jgi:hypothetical protein
VTYSDHFEHLLAYNPNNINYKGGNATSVTITVKNGDFISIGNAYNCAVFTPYTGKPDLGFK